MNIPTASDARRVIVDGQYERAVKQAAEIEELICDAIRHGALSISVDFKIEPAVKTKLEDLGYICSDHDYRNEITSSISWA